MDMASRNEFRKYGTHYPHSKIERFHLSTKHGGRGINQSAFNDIHAVDESAYKHSDWPINLTVQLEFHRTPKTTMEEQTPSLEIHLKKDGIDSESSH